MMKIVVTGASGSLGNEVVSRLLQEGCAVVGIDKRPSQRHDTQILIADLCDAAKVDTACKGADAIIHLGAYPSPYSAPTRNIVYSNNVTSQFNVFEAAMSQGIRRIVNVSSVSALGFPFQHAWFSPYYLPIDEAHPLLPQDAYGLSKSCGEEIAAAYCRRKAGTCITLRPSTIISIAETGRYEGLINTMREENGRHGVHDLWSYVDIRDVVEACWLALHLDIEGHQPFYITANDTTSELPTDVLLDEWFPDVPRRPGKRAARWSLLDGSRAKQILGYEPRYCWQDILQNSKNSKNS